MKGSQLGIFFLVLVIQQILAQPAPHPAVITKNWIAITRDNWPPAHGNDPFYFIHGENAKNPVFSLNTKLLQAVSLITKPTLSFQYWTDTDLGLFLYKFPNSHHHRDLKLVQAKWQQASLDKVSAEEWNGYKFENADDEFTVAFKDVQVHYTEKLAVSKFTSNPIHGYKSTNQTSGITQTGQNYKVSASPGKTVYLSFIDSQPVDATQDICYTLTKPTGSQPIELYLTYPKVASGIHLATLTQTQSFCLNDYIALRALQNYQLTLAVSNPKEFTFTLTRKPTTSKIVPKSPNHYSTTVPFTSGWLFYSKSFNYQIQGPQHSPKFKGFPGAPPIFWACDIVGNCFQYTRTQVNKDTSRYSLEPEYLKELEGSPFVRIKCDKGAVTDEQYKFSYDRNQPAHVMSSLVATFHQDNPDIPNMGTPILSGHHFTPFSAPKTTNYSIRFPIKHIDFRVNQAELSVHPAMHSGPAKANFTISKLTFSNEEHPTVVNDFTEYYKLRSAGSNEVKLHTADFFHMDSFETKSTVNGYFTIGIVVEPEPNKTTVGMAMEFKLVDADKSKVNYTDLPVSLAKNPNYRILNSKVDPKVSITSGLVHSDPTRTLPPYSIHLNLASYDKQVLKAGDLKVNQILFSQGTLTVVDKSAQIKLNQNGTSAVFADEGKGQATKLAGPLFSLEYEVILVNKAKQIEIGIESFELKNPDIKQTIVGPIIGTVNPKVDPIECPAGFKVGQEKTSCQLDYLYNDAGIPCASTGCSNIFDRSFLKSSVYFGSSTTPIKYIPYQPTTGTTGYLQITKPDTVKADQDYCIGFKYKSSKYPLVVSSSPQQSATEHKVEFAVGEKEEIVCAGKLGAAKEMYFRFNQAPVEDVDGHFVQILKAEVTHK